MRRNAAGLTISLINAYSVFLKFAKLWELQKTPDSQEPTRMQPGERFGRWDVWELGVDVFSLHIDTARTWRGGQSYVMQMVLGLRARGHRAVLVAHPEGELFRRMREGHDLIPLAPSGDIDLATAWRLSRVLKQIVPDVIHAHDPHAVAMSSTAYARQR